MRKRQPIRQLVLDEVAGCAAPSATRRASVFGRQPERERRAPRRKTFVFSVIVFVPRGSSRRA